MPGQQARSSQEQPSSNSPGVGYDGPMCGRVIVDYAEMIPAATNTALAEWVTAAPAGAASSRNLNPTQDLPVAYTDHKTGGKTFETAFEVRGKCGVLD